jgi:hypothetical protein
MRGSLGVRRVPAKQSGNVRGGGRGDTDRRVHDATCRKQLVDDNHPFQPRRLRRVAGPDLEGAESQPREADAGWW